MVTVEVPNSSPAGRCVNLTDERARTLAVVRRCVEQLQAARWQYRHRQSVRIEVLIGRQHKARHPVTLNHVNVEVLAGGDAAHAAVANLSVGHVQMAGCRQNKNVQLSSSCPVKKD